MTESLARNLKKSGKSLERDGKFLRAEVWSFCRSDRCGLWFL
jgi:hypothetical protein